MPYVEIIPTPRKVEQYAAFLTNNFRRIADALGLAADKKGDDDIEFTTSAAGVILTAPNGNRYRVTVSNVGALVVTGPL